MCSSGRTRDRSIADFMQQAYARTPNSSMRVPHARRGARFGANSVQKLVQPCTIPCSSVQLGLFRKALFCSSLQRGAALCNCARENYEAIRLRPAGYGGTGCSNRPGFVLRTSAGKLSYSAAGERAANPGQGRRRVPSAMCALRGWFLLTKRALFACIQPVLLRAWPRNENPPPKTTRSSPPPEIGGLRTRMSSIAAACGPGKSHRASATLTHDTPSSPTSRSARGAG